MRKIPIALAAAVAALGIILPSAASASAARPTISPACAAVQFCGGEQLDAPDLALAVRGGTELSGTPLIAATGSVDPAQDFYIHSEPAGGGVYIEAAPSGVRDGLCASEPSTGVRTAIVLRKCHANNAFQTFRREDIGSTSPFVLLVNRASGLAISDPSSGGNGTPLLSRNPGFGTALNELWQPEDGVG